MVPASHSAAFATDLEHALQASPPADALDRAWITHRMVNYHLGLLRLTIGVRTTEGRLESRGTIVLHFYALADGTPCLKATLCWAHQTETKVQPIFSRPSLAWREEARKIGECWIKGAPERAATG